MRRVMVVLLALVVLLGSLLGGGGVAAQTDTTQPVVVTFATADGSTFRAVLEQPEDIARAEAALAGDGYAGIPNGALAYGDGGVNAPHTWHMVGTTLADVTTEVCDGTASMVDADPVYWVETVGRFCPWTATVIAVEPLNAPDPDDGIVLPPPPGGPGEVDGYIEELIALLVALLQAILAGLSSPATAR